jgi:hypothetical protein
MDRSLRSRVAARSSPPALLVCRQPCGDSPGKSMLLPPARRYVLATRRLNSGIQQRECTEPRFRGGVTPRLNPPEPVRCAGSPRSRRRDDAADGAAAGGRRLSLNPPRQPQSPAIAGGPSWTMCEPRTVATNCVRMLSTSRGPSDGGSRRPGPLVTFRAARISREILIDHRRDGREKPSCRRAVLIATSVVTAGRGVAPGVPGDGPS